MKSKIVAGLLAIFIGGLGAHKFYLGKYFQGAVYLIFCWAYIPAIVALIEGICYLFMSDADFQEKYGDKPNVPPTSNGTYTHMSGGNIQSSISSRASKRQ